MLPLPLLMIALIIHPCSSRFFFPVTPFIPTTFVIVRRLWAIDAAQPSETIFVGPHDMRSSLGRWCLGSQLLSPSHSPSVSWIFFFWCVSLIFIGLWCQSGEEKKKPKLPENQISNFSFLFLVVHQEVFDGDHRLLHGYKRACCYPKDLSV